MLPIETRDQERRHNDKNSPDSEKSGNKAGNRTRSEQHCDQLAGMSPVQI